MSKKLITDVEDFLSRTGMSPYRFGYKAAKNGRLVERLREGGRIWPETEKIVRDFMAEAGSAEASQ